jgi:hypothetical protein
MKIYIVEWQSYESYNAAVCSTLDIAKTFLMQIPNRYDCEHYYIREYELDVWCDAPFHHDDRKTMPDLKEVQPVLIAQKTRAK